MPKPPVKKLSGLPKAGKQPQFGDRQRRRRLDNEGAKLRDFHAFILHRLGYSQAELASAFGMTRSAMFQILDKAKRTEEFTDLLGALPEIQLLTNRYLMLAPKALEVVEYHLLNKTTREAYQAAHDLLMTFGILRQSLSLEDKRPNAKLGDDELIRGIHELAERARTSTLPGLESGANVPTDVRANTLLPSNT